jgi:predicted dehydrogenase
MNKALIVGCGKIAGGNLTGDLNTHAGAIKNQKRICLAGALDSDLERAKIFCQYYNCLAFDNLQQALAELEPDLVSICTPDWTHFDICLQTLSSRSAPRVIFLEKPVCYTREEYYKLSALAEERNVKVLVNHTRRFDNRYSAIRDLIQSRLYGVLHRINAVYYGGWFHNGTHIVDTLLYLTRDQIKWNFGGARIDSQNVADPSIELTGRLANTNASVVVSAISEDYYQLFEFDLWFESARLRIENFGSRIYLESVMQNAAGERILQKIKTYANRTKRTEMQIAIGLICSYLDLGIEPQLDKVSLREALPTMETLWNGYEAFDLRRVI